MKTSPILTQEQSMPTSNNEIKNITEQLKNLVTELFILCQQTLAEIDITITQLKVICLVYGKTNHTVSSIANYLKVSKPTTTRIIDRLVQKDMLRRLPDSTDRRVIRCILSDEGAKILNNLWIEHSDITIDLLSEMNIGDLNKIEISISAIKNLVQNVQPRKSSQKEKDIVKEEYREPSSSDPWALVTP